MIIKHPSVQCTIITAVLFIHISASWAFTSNNGHNLQRSSTLSTGHCLVSPGGLSSDGEPGDETFYSPNIALDESKYRYDLDGDIKSDEGFITDPSSSFNEYSFFDEATIFVRGGSGGQGASTYKKGAGGQDGPPDGGNGGRGGDVVLEVDESLNTLAGLSYAWRPNSFGGSGASYKSAPESASVRPKSVRAENGSDGGRQFKNGRYAKETVIRVPPGTVVQEEVEIQNPGRGDVELKLVDIGSLTFESPRMIVAKGGEGGEGSAVAGKFGGRGVKRPRMPPGGGERKRLKLTLKIVADVALVGVPNAGKSTFLAAVTKAKPKIANYPFTTLIPNLGVWVPPEVDYPEESAPSGQEGGSGSTGLVLCDVPGLVAGAAKGVGLGHAFLRHVERCHVILHLVDATSNDPVADFEMLNREIVKYGTGQLAKMPQVVVVNKIDAFDGRGEDWEEGLKMRFSRQELEEQIKLAMPHSRLMWMSAKEREGVDDLMTRLAAFVKKIKEAKQ